MGGNGDQKFVPLEYWEIEAELEKIPSPFVAKLEKIEDKKAEIQESGRSPRL